MEKPGVDKDDNAIWNPDGERQRYAEYQLEELGAERIFVAAWARLIGTSTLCPI